jgi:O-antigen ligase
MYRDETLEIRRAENEYLFNKIKKNPLFGIGMVSQLRPSQFLAKEESGVYVHNGYLWILASLGIVGFFTFFWFYARFLGRGLSGWRKVRDTYLKAALAGFTLSGLGILLMSIVNPVLMQWKSVVVISTMIGLSEAIMRINESQVKT